MIQFLIKYNKFFIPISLIGALICAIKAPALFQHIHFLGELFINLLKLFALPLICSALVAALGGVSNNLSSLKALSKRSLLYMLLSEVIAVTIALCLFNYLKPGVGCSAEFLLKGQTYMAPDPQSFGIKKFLLSIFPDNIFQALTNFELLPVVIFSIMFGIGCALTGETAKPLVKIAIGVRNVSTKCLHGVMLLAPLGIFALAGSGMAQSYLDGALEENFSSLLTFVSVFILGLFLHGAWQLFAVSLFSKQKMSTILSQSVEVFSTAFGTSSSIATLPIAMQTANRLKAKPFATEFVLPLCAAVNVGGMVMYEMAAALFFSQMLGLDLSLSQQILLAIACILGGMAEGGIPETSMVSLVVVFNIVNIPLSAIAILLPLDRILDRLRTMVNIFGNMCGAILVSQSLKDPAARQHDPCSAEST